MILVCAKQSVGRGGIAMEAFIAELKLRKEKARLMGGEKKIAIQHELGHLTARERIDRLVDPDTFMELGLLNHSDVPGMEGKSPADGLISGIGKIDGRPVVIEASDRTVLAATEGTVHIRKSKMIREFAVKRGYPIINLGEGGGLRMPDGMGSDGISTKMMPPTLLRHGRQTLFIATIMGDSFGGPTWNAVSADFAVQVKGTCSAVSGPRMLEIATGERVTPEELGGWEIHAQVTGQIDCFAENDAHCLDIVQQFFRYMPSNAEEEPPFTASHDDPYRRLDEVVEIVPAQLNRVYDMKLVIKAIVDEGELFELKPYFGQALVTCLARIGGRVVGILANQPEFNGGAGGPDECDKATDFICLCDSYNVPMVFLHDTPGFLVGSDAEKHRMPTKIMVWNQALAWSTVPKVSVILRKTIGAAYGNMCGPDMGADFVVAWPGADISFTGAEVGVNVVYGRQLTDADNPSEERKRLLKQWSFDAAPWKAASKHLIDDVIDPRETRRFLSQALEYSCSNKGSFSKRLLSNWPTGF
jgi:acetyl-CoA carboxylase carboxyltransferase component